MTAPAPLTLTPTMNALAVGPFVAKDRDIVLQMTIPGNPCSKQRPRFVSKRVYTPGQTRKREEDVRAIAKSSMRDLVMDTNGLFSLRAAFFIATNKKQDVDNMLKLVADALTGIVWLDDRQVVEVFAYKVPPDTQAESRTEVVVCRMPGMIAYEMQTCLICQRQYRTYPSWGARPYCSRRCSAFAQRDRVAIQCARCWKRIEVKRYRLADAKHVYCSNACKYIPKEERACRHCGKKFMAAPTHRKKTCSVACGIAWKRRTRVRPASERGVLIAVEPRR